MSERLFHGTPFEIHTSTRPFLDPRLAVGRDDGDPEVGHVFATPDLLLASIFAFKDSGCRSIMRTADGPVVAFSGKPPASSAEGFVYEVPASGFRETMRRGKPSGQWAMFEQEMPLVRDDTENEVPGILVGEPIRRAAIRDLIEQDGLRIHILTGRVDTATYIAAVRDAIYLGIETTFVREAVEREWLCDITSHFLNAAAHHEQ